MPYVKNGDINIYYEVEGEGPPLVMLHGLTSSLEYTREVGYADALKNNYRLILLDARGHGKSDKPHDPAAYISEYVVGDVIAIMNDLGIESTNFFGYSYGGLVAFECAKYAAQRVKSVIVGGIGARTPPPEGVQVYVKNLEAGPEVFVAEYEQAGSISPGMKARMLANDHEAIIAVLKAVGSRTGVQDDLPGMIMPFLIFVGEYDNSFSAAKEASELLPDATFVLLPGLNHMQAHSRLDLVIPHIKEFLSRVN
jgi:pimeloyl-ACP methyl ester carboxylesterase